MNQNQLYPETLPAKTAQLVDLLQKEAPEFLSDFYLSGGTALSLQLGHRESEDLDFFIQSPFDPKQVQQQLMRLGKLEGTELAKGTINTFLKGVKLQFLEYPYDLLKPTINWQGLELSSIEDIACTKLQTIGMRGSKKDFIDLYFLLDRYPLEKLLKLMVKKYQKIDYSKTHIMKSLVYFEDAQQQPMPKMHQDVSWGRVKQKMIEAVKRIKFE